LVFATFATHLPKAFDLPPYFAVNAVAPSELRSVLHVLAALIVFSCCCSWSAFALLETH
jgi:hypothetical protein